MSKKIKVLVVGCGSMGAAHARGLHEIYGFEIVGLVSRGDSKKRVNDALKTNYKLYDNFDYALLDSKPEAVCISTHPDTHEEFAIKSFKAGCHVFLEKPIGPDMESSKRILAAAKSSGKKLLIGLILQHQPSWNKFVDIARTLGKPLVMRMNLNQQSKGATWEIHKAFVNTLHPMIDCGMHYIEVMCRMTNSKAKTVSGLTAKLSHDTKGDNYGHIQIKFEDGSVGWYEVGWGPMVSTKAFFVKDVWGPKGCATITAKESSSESNSDDVESHIKTDMIRLHHSELNADKNFAYPDEWISTSDELDHNGLCKREQEFFLRAILEDLDLSNHLEGALESMRICSAAHESALTGKTILL